MDFNFYFVCIVVSLSTLASGGLDGFYPYGSVISSCRGKLPNLNLDLHPAMMRVKTGGVAFAVEVWAVPLAGISIVLTQI